MEVIAVFVTLLGIAVGLVQLRDARRRKLSSPDSPEPLPRLRAPGPPTSQEALVTELGRTGYDNATSGAVALLGQAEPPETVVRYVETPAELYRLWRIDDAAYEQASITYGTFEGWWTAYPLGLRALFVGQQVAGAVGIWPISKQWAVDLEAGVARERDLPTSALTFYRSRPARQWYISGIVLSPRLRGGKAVRRLLCDGLLLWERSESLEYPVQLFAFAYSEVGAELLQRFSFRMVRSARQTADRFPLFGRGLEAGGVRKALHALGLYDH